MKVKLIRGKQVHYFATAMQWDTVFDAKLDVFNYLIPASQLRAAGAEFFEGDKSYAFRAHELEVVA